MRLSSTAFAASLTLLAGACATMGASTSEAPSPKFDPCDRATSACRSAGFSVGAQGGKNLLDDCLRPLARGASVLGVTVSSRVAGTCLRLGDFETAGTDESSPDSCGLLFRACRAGGYHEPNRTRDLFGISARSGNSTGNALVPDCIQPLLLGRQVQDVVADASEIDACLGESESAPGSLDVHGFSPCYRIQTACTRAGFVRAPQDPVKDLEAGCERPLMAGQVVPGVKLDPAIGPACSRLTALIESGSDTSPTGPCGAAVTACKTAGYYVGGSVERKGIQFDCLTPILLGHVPSSVKLDAAGAQACRTQPIPKPPCNVVLEACRAAGYYPGGMVEGKGISTNCEEPLLEGKPVPGVQIDPSVVKACAEQRGRGHSAAGANLEL